MQFAKGSSAQLLGHSVALVWRGTKPATVTKAATVGQVAAAVSMETNTVVPATVTTVAVHVRAFASETVQQWTGMVDSGSVGAASGISSCGLSALREYHCSFVTDRYLSCYDVCVNDTVEACGTETVVV